MLKHHQLITKIPKLIDKKVAKFELCVKWENKTDKPNQMVKVKKFMKSQKVRVGNGLNKKIIKKKKC